jgi:hypothetical protein
MKTKDQWMGQPSAISGCRPDETTYQEVNSGCEKIHWPQVTETIDSILAQSGSDTVSMLDEERKELSKRFWNEYVYPEYEKIYFDLFPRDSPDRDTGAGMEGASILDYNRKMILAFTQWLKENGFFHNFGGKILFLKYKPDALSWGSLLTDEALYDAYDEKSAATLLNGLSAKYLNAVSNYERTVKWLWGCGTVLTLLILWLVMKITG